MIKTSTSVHTGSKKMCGKKIVSVLLTVVMLIGCFGAGFTAFADDTIIAQGECGDSAHWKIVDDGTDKTFVVYGSGDMWTRSSWTGDAFDAWDITKIIIEEGITSICDGAFGGAYISSLSEQETSSCGGIVIYSGSTYYTKTFENVTGSLVIPNSVTTIGKRAFRGCRGFTGSLVIPDSVTDIDTDAFLGCFGLNGTLTLGNNLQTIGGGAFADCHGFTGSLTIPDSVTLIGEQSFRGCENFNGTLTIGNNVQTIGYLAFIGCHGFIGSLIIPNSVTSIGWGAFNDCFGFNGTITIGNQVQAIGDYTFQCCYNLTGSLVIPDSVTSIGNNAFYGCNRLETLTLGNSIQTIGDCAFSGCYGFTGSLVIPNSVTTIGSQAFIDCNGFNGMLILGNNVQTIGGKAFCRCYNLTGTLVIPDSVTSVGVDAFHFAARNTNGSSIYYGELEDSNPYKFFEHYRGDSQDDDYQFVEVVEASRTEPTSTQDGTIVYNIYCADDSHERPSLAATVIKPLECVPINVSTITATPNPISINVNESEQLFVEVLPADANNKTVSYSSSDDTVAIVDDTGLVTGMWEGSAIITITANDGSGVSTTVPVTVTDTFVIASDITVTPDPLYVEVGESKQLSIDFLPVNTTYKTVTCFCPENLTATVTNEGLVTGVSEGTATVFIMTTDGSGINKTVSVIVTAPVPVIARGQCGDTAYWKIIDDGIDKMFVVYGSGDMWNRRDWTGDAFDAWDITKIVIEEGITSIGFAAFGQDMITDNGTCQSTSSFGGDEEIFEGQFNEKIFINATSVTIPETILAIGDFAFQNCSRLTGSLIIPDSVTTIGDSAFNNCSGFNDTLILGKNLQIISQCAFQNCSGFIGSLVIPNSVTLIGSASFSGCYGFYGTLTLGNNVQVIESSAFSSCFNFTGSLTIPNTVTTIGNSAFSSCSAFDGTLTLGNHVQTIGDYAFSGCLGFTGSLAIPNSTTSIGNRAFYECSGFNGTLTLGKQVQTIGNDAFDYCGRLTGSLVIPNSTTSIGNYAFANCFGFNGVLALGNGIQTIGNYAFYCCRNLTGTLVIPANVTIGKCAFHQTASYTNGSNTYNGKLEDCNPYNFFEYYRDADSSPQLIEVVEASRTEPTLTQNGKIVYKIYCKDAYHNGAHTNSNLFATVNEPIEYVSANVSSITATPNPVFVNVGATEQLSVEVLPADAANKTVSYSSSDDTIATVSNTGLVTGVSKGTATVTITANDGSGTTAVVPVTVNKQIVAIPNADATVFVYDGSLKTYTIPASEFYSVSGNTQTNAGHHTVIVSLNNTDACEWSDETIAAKTYDFYIAPATTELTLPTGKTVEYSGAEQQIVNPGSTSNGTIQYKITAINGEPVDNAEWSDEIPAATNAGNYTIAYQVVDTDANHTVPASGTFEAVITKAAIEKPAVGDNSFTYDGTEKTYIPGDGNGYVVTDNTGTDAGNYVAHVTPDDNHVWADENNSDPVDYPFVINRKPVTPPTVDTTEFVYDGTEQTCNIPAGEDYTVSNNKATDIGNYTATVTLNDTNNFEWTDGTTDPKTIPFEIVKRTATLTPPTGKSLTFNGSAQELVNAGVVKDGEDTINNAIQYRIIKIDDVDVVTAWSNEIPTQTVVGSYVIEYQIVLDDTYNAISGGTVNTTIENGTTEATPPQAITGLVYDSESKDLVVPGTIQHGSIEYAIVKVNGTDVSDPQWSTSVPSAVNAGEYVVGYRYIVDAGYNAVDGETVTASIAKQPIAKPAAGDNTFTYDGNEKTYTPGDGNGYVVTDNKATDAGDYVAHITPDDNHVWADDNNSTPVDYPFTIDKATVEKPAASTTTYQYDGTEKTYNIPESALYDVTGDKRTDAGSQTVTVTLTDPDNYTWADGTTDPIEFTFTVGKASIDFTATGYEGAYDGAPHTISVVVNSPAGATVTYSLTQDGEYTTTCPSVTGDPTQTTTTIVYYKIEKDNNYTPAAGSETIKLNHEHTPGTPVRVEVSDKYYPSTSPEVYSFDMAIYCTTCGDEIDRYTVVLHFVDARTPTESEDGYHEHYEDDDGTIYTWDGTKYVETDVTWHYATIAADSLLMIPTEVLSLNARSDIQTITADDFTYSSLNESVATVDNNGMVTAIAPGRAIVRVSAKDASNEEYVTEAQISVVDADINVSYYVPVGTTSQVDSNVYPSGTEVLGIVYETSDNNIATVNNDGVVNAVAEGEIEVTVNITISDNGMTRTLTLNAPLDTNSHILSHVDEIPATEDHDGVKEHWECTDQDCDKKFWDENGSDLIEDENDLVIHYPGEAEMSNPVCNDDEEKYSFDLTVKCVNDDTVIDGPTTVILTKHDAVDSTPEHDGNDKYFTDGSGKIYIWDAANETYKPVDAYVIRHYHDFKWENIDLDPDCIHTGIGDYVEYCPNCGLEFNREDDKDIPATSIHTPGEPHQENYVAPTCTTKGGYDTVVRCTVCEVVLSSVHTELAALGHDWAVTNESYTTAPTCISSGTKTTEYTCSRCGATKTDEITAKPLGHTDADKDDYCDRCHEQVSWRCSKCDWYDENKDTPGIFGIIVKIVHVIVHMVEKVNHLT